jgi:hypothetical protein
MLSSFEIHFIFGAIVDIAFGAQALFFDQDLARGMNRFSVKVYETFPRLKKAITKNASGWF